MDQAAASAPNAWPRRRNGDDALNDSLEPSDDVMLRDPQHLPAQRAERAVTCGVMTNATVMRAAVDFDDQAHLGASEVRDVVADDELTTKREAGLRPRERTPEMLLTARGEKRMKRARSAST